MSIEYGKSQAVFREEVGIDEAEELLQWLQRTPGAKVDLSFCAHLHPANVQVLMASGAIVVAWPGTPGWRIWLESALQPSRGGE
jgi:hypothetical protein